MQLCIVRVTVNLWEVAFNDLKQFARVDSEKQGAQNWTKESGHQIEINRRHVGAASLKGKQFIFCRISRSILLAKRQTRSLSLKRVPSRIPLYNYITSLESGLLKTRYHR